MSTRHLRKIAEQLQQMKMKEALEEPVDDFEPLYTKRSSSAYSGLVLSSSSTTEAEDDDDDLLDMAAMPATNKVNRKKNNKRNKRKRKKAAVEASLSDSDEVERSVREVNEILGEPEAPAPAPEPKAITLNELLKIEHKHLNYNYELDRVFGPDDEEKVRKTDRNRHTRRQITFTKDNYKFKVRGFEMVLIEVKNGVKYFKFSHSAEYQKHMHALMQALKPHYNSSYRAEPEIFPSDTVEGLIENLNFYFQLDEPTIAVDALEQAISFMQKTADQAFNYIDGKTRLEYKYVENRVFHVSLLEYLHILTNKACHRTALEVAKLMLNLDPSDPLGVIFMIDTLALRAREHRWLLEIYDRWKDEKDVSKLFHMRYSVALAMWHVAKSSKDPDDKRAANALMKLALVKFPNVACMIMGFTAISNEDIMTHEIFTTMVNLSTPADLLALQLLYAKFVAPKWRDNAIMDWVISNALEIITRFKDDPCVQENLEKAGAERNSLFQKYPLQIKRHLNCIRNMSSLLADGEVPQVKRTLSFNPYPSEGKCIDEHRYYKDWGVVYPQEEPEPGIVRSFISSLIPDTRGGESRCCDRHDIIRLYPGEAVPHLTLEEEMFREDVPEDMYNPSLVRPNNGYSQRRREHQLRRERAFAVKVRRSAACSDVVTHHRSALARITARHQRKNKRHVREQAALILRHN